MMSWTEVVVAFFKVLFQLALESLTNTMKNLSSAPWGSRSKPGTSPT